MMTRVAESSSSALTLNSSAIAFKTASVRGPVTAFASLLCFSACARSLSGEMANPIRLNQRSLATEEAVPPVSNCFFNGHCGFRSSLLADHYRAEPDPQPARLHLPKRSDRYAPIC